MIAAYNFVVGIVFFGALRLAGRLRKDKVCSQIFPSWFPLNQATEQMGSDWVNHGEESYPEAAWLQLEVAAFSENLLEIIKFEIFPPSPELNELNQNSRIRAYWNKQWL